MKNTTGLQVSILAADPLVKLGARESYRIRVVRVVDSLDAVYAIAATRCEFPRYTEYLSTEQQVPLEVVKRMRNGFALRSDATERAKAIFSALIDTGIAQIQRAQSAA